MRRVDSAAGGALRRAILTPPTPRLGPDMHLATPCPSPAPGLRAHSLATKPFGTLGGCAPVGPAGFPPVRLVLYAAPFCPGGVSLKGLAPPRRRGWLVVILPAPQLSFRPASAAPAGKACSALIGFHDPARHTACAGPAFPADARGPPFRRSVVRPVSPHFRVSLFHSIIISKEESVCPVNPVSAKLPAAHCRRLN